MPIPPQQRSEMLGMHAGLSDRITTTTLPLEIPRHRLAEQGLQADLAL
jgi:hypothetical protein